MYKHIKIYSLIVVMHKLHYILYSFILPAFRLILIMRQLINMTAVSYHDTYLFDLKIIDVSQ